MNKDEMAWEHLCREMPEVACEADPDAFFRWIASKIGDVSKDIVDASVAEALERKQPRPVC